MGSLMFKALGLMTGIAVVAIAAAQTPQGPATGPPDPEILAQRIVNECAGIRNGEMVLVTGGTRDLSLLESIAVEVRRLGAHPLLTIETENLERRFYTDVPAQLDAQKPTFALRLAELIDAHIYIDYRENPDLLANIAPQRLNDTQEAEMAVEAKLLERAVRQVYLGNDMYPTKARAQQFNMSTQELARIFWSGVNVNYEQLQMTGEQIRTRLARGNEVRIIAPNGTDLRVKITKRPAYVSDGIISTSDRQEGNPACQTWLPAGEVYVTPVPGTANGTFVADNYFHDGKLIEGLRLEFKDGRLTAMTARGDVTALKRRCDAAPPGHDVFSFIDVGINPNIRIPAGSRMVNYMAAGAITVGMGDNSWAGGDNRVPFWVSAHLAGGTLTVDGEAVVERGELKTGKIE